jgi:hypothetical protein
VSSLGDKEKLRLLEHANVADTRGQQAASLVSESPQGIGSYPGSRVGPVFPLRLGESDGEAVLRSHQRPAEEQRLGRQALDPPIIARRGGGEAEILEALALAVGQRLPVGDGDRNAASARWAATPWHTAD